MLKYSVTIDKSDGTWHVVYTRPGRREIISVCKCHTEAEARLEMARKQTEQFKKKQEQIKRGKAPRRIVHGFYNDEDME